ncbi:MAG: guanylate kinase [Lachnospiraceae bacterium]|nr:guanylate kinase [Lachnospiraceae bacterium]
MGKIFYLMGKSSSGKDTIYNKLLQNKKLNLQKIVLYTTRPIRAGEENGIHYYYVDEKKTDELIKAGKVIELRAYDTFYGVWKYFTVHDDQIDLEKSDYLMIGTIESFQKTKAYFGSERVVPIMIELDDGVRLQRALDRERKEEHPRYEEMCRRFLADSIDFSPEKKKEAGIEKEFYNQNLEECLCEIEAYILSNQ